MLFLELVSLNWELDQSVFEFAGLSGCWVVIGAFWGRNESRGSDGAGARFGSEVALRGSFDLRHWLDRGAGKSDWA